MARIAVTEEGECVCECADGLGWFQTLESMRTQCNHEIEMFRATAQRAQADAEQRAAAAEQRVCMALMLHLRAMPPQPASAGVEPWKVACGTQEAEATETIRELKMLEPTLREAQTELSSIKAENNQLR